MMLDRRWLFPSVVIILIAFFYRLVLDRVDNDGSVAKIREEHADALYVIGDLHGDVHCARYWVEQTGLVENAQSPPDKWTWTDQTSSLVFMGDYIDKGPTSRQTVEFVKALTEKFPNHVTALMGNHEMELLRDRDLAKRWGGGEFFQLPYASVYPGEYLNFVQDKDEVDELVVDALYNASLEVYGNGRYRTMISPSAPDQASVLQYVDSDLRDIVKDRLSDYQKSYMNAYATGTELGTWLEQRPVLHRYNDTILFVHGGVSPEVASVLRYRGGVERMNQLLAANAQQGKLNHFLDSTAEGNAIYDMLVYRGHFAEGGCQQLEAKVLQDLGLSNIGVGHTPSGSVRIMCGGQLLALDSALGRWFRSSGNEYCPGKHEQVSSNGHFRCLRIVAECEGQIVRIRANGVVEVIGNL